MCYNEYTRMLQVYVSSVSGIPVGCCKVDLDVHMLQCLYMYVANLCSKCFILFSNTCCKCFSLDIAKLILEVAKVHLLFKFPHTRAKQSEWNRVRAWKGEDGTVPPGPCARATEWAGQRVKWRGVGADLPRVRVDKVKQGSASGGPGTRRSVCILPCTYKAGVPIIKYSIRPRKNAILASRKVKQFKL
jgi:hypothetical protein